MDTSITLLVKEIEKVCKQIHELKQNNMKIEEYVKSMSDLTETKDNLLKIMFNLNLKVQPTVSDYALSLYTFFDDIDVKNMKTTTFELKDILDDTRAKKIHSLLYNLIPGNNPYMNFSLEFPICNIEIQKYVEIHNFLNIIKYEPYLVHSNIYYLKKTYGQMPSAKSGTYTPIFAFIGLNMPDPGDTKEIKFKMYDNTPCRYLSIFLMYYSLVKQKNVINITEEKNDTFSFEFKDNCDIKYLYIVNEIPIKILPTGYTPIKLQSYTNYFFYSKVFI